MFMFHSAIRKVFEFFLFDRTLFSLLPYKKGQQVKLNKRLFVWPLWLLACSFWAGHRKPKGQTTTC